MNVSETILSSFLSKLEKEKTKRDYRRDIYTFLNFIEKDFLDANLEDCKNYIEELNHLIEIKKMALSTAEKFYSEIYSFFNYLEENNYIEYNHFKNIHKPTATRNISSDRIIKWEELDQLISVLKTYSLRDFSICMLIFTSGLTLQEAVHLKWNQFFEDNKGHIGIIFTTKKGERYVKVHPDIWKLLNNYQSQQEGIVSKDDYVFLNNRGKRITGRWVRMILQKACEEANLSHSYTPRDLRHALAAYALKKGAAPHQVKEQLGWSHENLADRYLYTIQQLEDNAIDYLNFSLKEK
ncbi:tyrosine-type recombinase/integrase [Inediibacterium massiliense]|uniref:tyrosine-type recombinase/integrase n=1 Tax=Inediibacterium massiliense TaxID=1658111 RepID=UPI0006B45586|nr:tyrosine-type recombinase/integrase [Inediibacterium massiliense]